MSDFEQDTDFDKMKSKVDELVTDFEKMKFKVEQLESKLNELEQSHKTDDVHGKAVKDNEPDDTLQVSKFDEINEL